MGKQATKTIKALRIKMVINMLQAGKYHFEIVNELSELWQCSERNAERYITAAFKLIKVNYDKNAAETILAKYEHLYRKALSSGDLKTSVKVLDSIAKIKGLAAPEKHEHIVKTINVNVPDEPDNE